MARSVHCPQIVYVNNPPSTNTFGQKQMVAGSVTFSNTNADNNSVYIASINSWSGFNGYIEFNEFTTGVSANISSTNASDTSIMNYLILKDPMISFGATTFPIGIPLIDVTLNNANAGVVTLVNGVATVNTPYASIGPSALFLTNYAGQDFPNTSNVYPLNFTSTSFEIHSANVFASNRVAYYILDLSAGQIVGGVHQGTAIIEIGNGNASDNAGTGQLVGGTLSIPSTLVTSSSVVLCTTNTLDPNPANNGILMASPDPIGQTLDFFSTNSNDTQKFSWWHLESSAGFS